MVKAAVFNYGKRRQIKFLFLSGITKHVRTKYSIALPTSNKFKEALQSMPSIS